MADSSLQNGLGVRENNALFAAWLVALFSTLSILFIGEVLGQTPCILCWFQRAFMFPLAIILGVGLWYSDKNVWRYGLPLSLGGLAIALYHTLLYFGIIPEAIQPCSDSGPSCTDQGMVILGLPIPLLSVGAFLMIFVLLLQLYRGRNS